MIPFVVIIGEKVEVVMCPVTMLVVIAIEIAIVTAKIHIWIWIYWLGWRRTCCQLSWLRVIDVIWVLFKILKRIYAPIP